MIAHPMEIVLHRPVLPMTAVCLLQLDTTVVYLILQDTVAYHIVPGMTLYTQTVPVRKEYLHILRRIMKYNKWWMVNQYQMFHKVM